MQQSGAYFFQSNKNATASYVFRYPTSSVKTTKNIKKIQPWSLNILIVRIEAENLKLKMKNILSVSHHSKMQKNGWTKYIPNFGFK